MQSNTTKKLITYILFLSLLVSIIPGVVFASTEDTITHSFTSSTDDTRSKTIYIDGLQDAVNLDVDVDNGNVSYTTDGDYITVNVSNGTAKTTTHTDVRYEQVSFSRYLTDSGSFPTEYPNDVYDDKGQLVTLSKTGSPRYKYTDTNYFYQTLNNVFHDTRWERTVEELIDGFWTRDTTSSGDAYSSYYYSNNGYSGNVNVTWERDYSKDYNYVDSSYKEYRRYYNAYLNGQVKKVISTTYYEQEYIGYGWEKHIDTYSQDEFSYDVTINYTIDTLNPSISVTSTNNSDYVEFIVTASDDTGIDYIELPDGSTVQNNTSSYTVTSNGNYTFKAIDLNGNIISKTMSITSFDTLKPNISYTVNSNDNYTDIIISATDNIEIDYIELPDGTQVQASGTSYSVTSNGDYTFKAVDINGNELIKTITISNIEENIDDLIQEVINNPTEEIKENAWNKIHDIEDEVIKQEKFDTLLSYDSDFREIHTQVNVAKETKERQDIVDALEKVKTMSDTNAYKIELSRDANILKFRYNKEIKYGNINKISTYYVDKTEKFPTVYYIDRANYFINLVEDDISRSELVSRVNIIADKIYKKVDRYALEMATKYVNYAETYASEELINKATALVKDLESSIEKTSLITRLNNI